MLFKDKYWFLSNMYPCRIEYNGYVFNSIEAAFQAQKDPKRAVEFTALNGFEAKRLGKQVALRADWEEVKLTIMEDLLRIKFSDKVLRQWLCQINEPIVEDNHWHDTYWGMCNGRGQNNLGKLIEKIKQEY